MRGSARRATTAANIASRVAWNHRVTALGLALALYGLASVATDLPTPLDLSMAIIGAGATWGELSRIRTETQRLAFVDRSGDTYEDVEVPADSLRINSSSGTGFYYGPKSATLRTRRVEALLLADDFRIHPSLEEFSLTFLTRQRGSTFFNGQVVGLASFELGDDASGDDVRLRSCAYFDFLATNVMAKHDVEDPRGTVLEGRRLFFDRHGRLRSFAKSRLSNTVGISTLAFSADGKLILVQQTQKNVGSPGLRAPSGSGALERQDAFRVPDRTVSLSRVLLHGMERELREECNLQESEIETSALTGFGRWLSRGAMPEFSGVTLLSVEGDDITRRGTRRSEREYVHGIRAIRMLDMADWNPNSPLSMLPDSERDTVSFPLALALMSLQQALQDPSWALRPELAKRLTL